MGASLLDLVEVVFTDVRSALLASAYFKNPPEVLFFQSALALQVLQMNIFITKMIKKL